MKNADIEVTFDSDSFIDALKLKIYGLTGIRIVEIKKEKPGN